MVTIAVGADWTSGVYLALLTESKNGDQSYIVFVVRDDERASDYLFQSSVTTFQAYNEWPYWETGGNTDTSPSLYPTAVKPRGDSVSFDRPYGLYGIGGSHRFPHKNVHSPQLGLGDFFFWELNMLRWLEREGYDVTYCTNIDTHSRADLLTSPRHKMFLSVGHDEYWSEEMRRCVQAGVDSGVHLAVFSANTCYRRITFSDSTCRVIQRDPATEATEFWQDEAKLIGVAYMHPGADFNGVMGDFTIAQPGHWLCKNAFPDGVESILGVVGYEADEKKEESPTNVETIGDSPLFSTDDPSIRVQDTAGNEARSQATLYWTQGGTMVFAAGTIQWSWGLDDFFLGSYDFAPRPHVSPALQRITQNLLDRAAVALMVH